MKINPRYYFLILCGILLFLLAANFTRIDSRLVNLAAASVVVLLTARTDMINGIFMSLLFTFSFYSFHAGENIPALVLNTAVFSTAAFLTEKLKSGLPHAAQPAAGGAEKDFVRKVTSSLMLAHEMACEIQGGMDRGGLLGVMAKNISGLFDADQVLVYSEAGEGRFNLALSSGNYKREQIKNPAMLPAGSGIYGRNNTADALDLIDGRPAGFYLLLHTPGAGNKYDIVVLFREKEFEHSDIYIVEFFVAQVYAVLERQKLASGVKENYKKIIEALTIAIRAKDNRTLDHSLDTMYYAERITDRLGIQGEEKEKIKYASLLHDIGKISVSSMILNKPDRLSAEEYEIIKMHPAEGAGILKKLEFFDGIMPIILHHHEHVDGQGYPGNLRGDEIPLGARICAIADAYSAMVSDKPYRRAVTKEQALQELKRCAGTQFDSGLVDVFVGVIRDENITEPLHGMRRGSVN